jgi:crotonobetainyl-CoA hydratase
MNSDSSPVTAVRDGATGIITINRPRSMNAITAEVAQLAGDALEAMDHDDAVRAIVVTGTGPRAFCTGADLKEFASGILPYAENEAWGFAGLTEHVVSTPVIAAVNGAALGGGLEIVLWADLVISADTAVFGLPEVRVGVIAGAGGLIRLPRQVAPRVALQMALTGEPIDARVALGLGLVNQVVNPDEVLSRAVDLAERIGRNAPLAVAASKRVLKGIADGTVADESEAWELNNREMHLIRASDDAAEGPRAFAEKRTPVWAGR